MQSFNNVPTKASTENSKEIFLEAIKNEDIEKLKILTQKHARTKKSNIDLNSFKSDDTDESPVLHLAVRFNKINLIAFFLERNVETNSKDKNGNTPLYLAIILKHNEIAKILIEKNANLQVKNNDGLTIIDACIDTKNLDVFEVLYKKMPNIIRILYLNQEKKCTNLFQSIFKMIIENDQVDFFKQLISDNILFQENLYNIPKESKINNFLQYKPARREKNINKYKSISDYIRENNLNKLKNLIDDYEHTSDEESSDSESDDFQKNNNFDINLIQTGKMLVRGVHFSPEFFKSSSARKNITHNSGTLYSPATVDIADRLNNSNKHADGWIKDYFKLLQSTPDKIEYNSNNKKITRKKNNITAIFPTLRDRLIHVYVNKDGHTELFKNQGMIRNFNFSSSKNLFISSSSDIQIGLEYSSGIKITNIKKYSPKVRISTGKLKHRRLGYLGVYFIDSDYLKNHAMDIDKLAQATENKLHIASNYRHNKEIVIISSIPHEAILGYQVISLPNFNQDWTSKIETQFGLSKSLYTKYQNKLNTCSTHEEINNIMENIIENIINFYIKKINNDIVAIKKTIYEGERDLITKMSKHSYEFNIIRVTPEGVTIEYKNGKDGMRNIIASVDSLKSRLIGWLTTLKIIDKFTIFSDEQDLKLSLTVKIASDKHLIDEVFNWLEKITNHIDSKPLYNYKNNSSLLFKTNHNINDVTAQKISIENEPFNCKLQ